MLLRVPPPEVIDHAPVVALPFTVAPERTMAAGVADWHTVMADPAFTVGAAVTVTVALPLTFVLHASPDV